MELYAREIPARAWFVGLVESRQAVVGVKTGMEVDAHPCCMRRYATMGGVSLFSHTILTLVYRERRSPGDHR